MRSTVRAWTTSTPTPGRCFATALWRVAPALTPALGLLAGPALLGTRVARRRRPEHALDAG
jgi:hypothetical protein